MSMRPTNRRSGQARKRFTPLPISFTETAMVVSRTSGGTSGIWRRLFKGARVVCGPPAKSCGAVCVESGAANLSIEAHDDGIRPQNVSLSWRNVLPAHADGLQSLFSGVRQAPQPDIRPRLHRA